MTREDSGSAAIAHQQGERTTAARVATAQGAATQQ
jgi:hypothetical protein